MTFDRNAALGALAAVVGADQVLADGDLVAYEQDWRRRWRGRALAVVRPASSSQVADVVRCCAQLGLSLVPQGGNTGLVGGGVPDDSGSQVLLSLRRLNRIRSLDKANLALVAEAGCVLQQVQEAAAAEGLMFPLSLAAEGSCTLGGNLATNAGGTQVLRYGNARALCLGLEVVTADGDLWEGLSGLRKDNTGYDLRDLFIGSEGTLGIITAATMALVPRPAAVTTALAACSSPRDALWLLEQSDGEGEAQARSRFESRLGAALEQGVIGDAVVAESVAQSRALWQLRESIPLAQSQEGLNIKHDISVPVSAIPAFVEQTDAELQRYRPGIRLVDFGHMGDGNLHYNVQAPAGEDAQLFLAGHEEAVNRIVYDAVQRFGGSISAEHGIGVLKRDELVQRKGAVELALMRAIKQALDPAGRLNPGRVVQAR